MSELYEILFSSLMSWPSLYQTSKNASEPSVNTYLEISILTTTKTRCGDIEKFKIRSGRDDRSLIILQHARCLETVELGYRNVSLSGHPASLSSISFSLLSFSSLAHLRDSQCFDRSAQLNNTTILTATAK